MQNEPCAYGPNFKNFKISAAPVTNFLSWGAGGNFIICGLFHFASQPFILFSLNTPSLRSHELVCLFLGDLCYFYPQTSTARSHRESIARYYLTMRMRSRSASDSSSVSIPVPATSLPRSLVFENSATLKRIDEGKMSQFVKV